MALYDTPPPIDTTTGRIPPYRQVMEQDNDGVWKVKFEYVAQAPATSGTFGSITGTTQTDINQMLTTPQTELYGVPDYTPTTGTTGTTGTTATAPITTPTITGPGGPSGGGGGGEGRAGGAHSQSNAPSMDVSTMSTADLMSALNPSLAHRLGISLVTGMLPGWGQVAVAIGTMGWNNMMQSELDRRFSAANQTPPSMRNQPTSTTGASTTGASTTGTPTTGTSTAGGYTHPGMADVAGPTAAEAASRAHAQAVAQGVYGTQTYRDFSQMRESGGYVSPSSVSNTSMMGPQAEATSQSRGPQTGPGGTSGTGYGAPGNFGAANAAAQAMGYAGAVGNTNPRTGVRTAVTDGDGNPIGWGERDDAGDGDGDADGSAPGTGSGSMGPAGGAQSGGPPGARGGPAGGASSGGNYGGNTGPGAAPAGGHHGSGSSSGGAPGTGSGAAGPAGGASNSGPGAAPAGGHHGAGSTGTGGTGAGPGTGQRVICTELYRQGLMPREDWKLDLWYTQNYLSRQHIIGYWYYAIPMVKIMRKNKLVTNIWRHIAVNRTQDIKWRLGKGKFNLLGRLYSTVLETTANILGHFVKEKDYTVLYKGERQW